MARMQKQKTMLLDQSAVQGVTQIVSGAHLDQPQPHALSPGATGTPQLIKWSIVPVDPIAYAVLQDILGSFVAVSIQPHTAMQRHPPSLTLVQIHPLVDATVQDITIIEDGISSLHLDHFHALQFRHEGVRIPLLLRPDPPVTSGNNHQALVIDQGDIVLGMRLPSAGALLIELTLLLLRIHLGADVISVPAQLKVLAPTRRYEQIEQFHHDLFLAAWVIQVEAQQLLDHADDGVPKVEFGELLATGHVGVEEVLHAPDAAVGGGGGRGGPGGELFGDGADVRPFAGAGEVGAVG